LITTLRTRSLRGKIKMKSRRRLKIVRFQGIMLKHSRTRINKGHPRKNEYKRSSKQDKSSMYANLFNDYCFSCTNFGHMARNWKAYDRYNYKGHYQNPRSKVVGTPDRIHDDFDNKKYMSFVQSFRPNIECYKYHNYGHIAHNCRYKMEPSVKDNPNIRYKKI